MPSTRSSRSRRTVLTAALLGAIALGVVAYVTATRDGSSPGPTVVDSPLPDDPGLEDVAVPGIAEPGMPAPPLEAETLDGGTVDLAALRGRPVVVNFWASWCYPCRAEFPLLAEVHEEGEVAVVGVVYNDIPSDARAFAAERDAMWPQALDERGAIARDWGVRSIPRTFYLDADGIIQAAVFGFTEESFRRQVDRLTGG